MAVPRSRAPLRVQNLRVNNVEIPNSKRVEISLQYIYGIGSTTAKQILVDTVRHTATSGTAALSANCSASSSDSSTGRWCLLGQGAGV